jgi:hypothetical protein
MIFLAGLIVIGVKGLFHSDWLGGAWQHLLLPTAGSGRDKKIRNP